MTWDEALYEELKADNENELESIQKEEDEAQEKAGETEVQAARGKRAEFLTRIGEKVFAASSRLVLFSDHVVGQSYSRIRKGV